VDGWDLALGVCYDGCFPEHAASAAAGGATAYLCPSAYYVGSEHRRDLYYAARALDNGIYVVFAGLTGRCGEHAFNGGSAVYDPEGRPLGRAGDESPAVVVADLDPAEVRRVQAVNPIAEDRLDSQGTRTRVVLSS
jgi:predicted amidohydrolase